MTSIIRGDDGFDSGVPAGATISGLAYGPWLVTTGTSNAQNSYVASVADDNDWLFVKVRCGYVHYRCRDM